jgi:hypothetical protein
MYYVPYFGPLIRNAPRAQKRIMGGQNCTPKKVGPQDQLPMFFSLSPFLSLGPFLEGVCGESCMDISNWKKVFCQDATMPPLLLELRPS